jgi:hypothetical protein
MTAVGLSIEPNLSTSIFFALLAFFAVNLFVRPV